MKLETFKADSKEIWNSIKDEWKKEVLELVNEYRETGYQEGATGRDQKSTSAPIFEEIVGLLNSVHARQAFRQLKDAE